MIKIENITKKYGDKIAVDHLSLEIRDGEIFGFIGPNGAGKTTTIKMITGITGYDEGEITLNNIDITKHPVEAKKTFGFVPDSPDMFLRLKGIEYLNFIADIYEVPEDVRPERFKSFAEKFDMQDHLNEDLQSYSHGMRQKIILMGALIHEPKIWILDEPMTGLDPKSSYALKEMMHEHASKGNSVFFSTHVLEVAEKLCDRIGIINHGKLVYCGTMDELDKMFPNESSLEKIFLEMTSGE
ncbi:MAG: ABC transporter ATP-binding protein [Bacilli bacterium]|jgi:ABC-2 type transport system ATP-binding protein|nr:ABC transporter ATP-binding protein [Bacilli bacterium]MDD3422119.1 ABC transporter ATP-binding protein [Bacilli bacterium]MDD4065419.1 ABC transporter ATP-binding protein [Bacilli bacterium]